MRYPPFCDIILIGISSNNYNELTKSAEFIYQNIKQKIKDINLPIILYKPVPAPIDKIKNKFRWRIIVKCKIDNNIINEISETISKANNNIKNSKYDTRIIVDTNPCNML